jgi:hypothetical protein
MMAAASIAPIATDAAKYHRYRQKVVRSWSVPFIPGVELS